MAKKTVIEKSLGNCNWSNEILTELDRYDEANRLWKRNRNIFPDATQCMQKISMKSLYSSLKNPLVELKINYLKKSTRKSGLFLTFLGFFLLFSVWTIWGTGRVPSGAFLVTRLFLLFFVLFPLFLIRFAFWGRRWTTIWCRRCAVFTFSVVCMGKGSC